MTLTGCPANGIRGEIDQELRVYSYDDPTLEYRPMATTRSARLLTTLPAAGYYHVYTLNPADSGGWQVNESLALRVRNTQNALGNPIYTNCLNKWVLQDPDNGRPVALGTQFYAGTFIFDTTDNIFQVSHYCPVYRTGECQDLHTVREPRASCDSPYPGDHSVTDNSVELYPQSFCLIPAN
ncbi:MAG: hypothetical protein KDD69_14400 [Bdellovibrionales bacterium]|nr:hypothetical protein [Bdellovibrionales bacterium]